MRIVAAIGKHRLLFLVGVLTALIGLGTVSSSFLVKENRQNASVQVDEQVGVAKKESRVGRNFASTELPLNAGPESAPDKSLNDRAEYDRTAVAGQTPVPGLSLPPLQDRVIKMGSIALKIKRDKFSGAYDQVVMIAKTNGGYVAGSNSNTADDRLVSGTLTIRVPSKNFETVLSKLRRVGKMTAININSRDVSTEFVDLESRLRHWRAQEAILLNLMDKASSITDSIAVQQQLSQVQMQIEQISGRLNYLKDQTDYSSLTVTINEPGIGPEPIDAWGLKSAVSQAAHAFVNTTNGLIVLAGYLSPLLLILGLAGLIWIGVRRWTATA